MIPHSTFDSGSRFFFCSTFTTHFLNQPPTISAAMFPYNNPFGDWTEGSNVQTPSVYGALPYPSGTISSDFVTFQFFNFQPDIFNCTVIGPQTQIYYQVMTDAQNPGYTVIKDGKGKNLALVEWQAHPFVELRGTLPKQPVGNWLKLPPAKQ